MMRRCVHDVDRLAPTHIQYICRRTS